MKKTMFLCFCLLSCSTVCTIAQPSESMTPSRYVFRLTRLLLKDGTAKAGWLLGTHPDSLILQVGGRSERIPRHDLLRVVIETEPQKSKPALIGILAGMYLGNALVLKAENQPFLFLRNRDGAGVIVLYNAIFSLVGGGIGYLVGSTRSNETIFDFAGSEEENAARWVQLGEGGANASRKGSFHLSFQASWVSGPLPHDNNRYNYYEMQTATAWNMMRKLQLTYSITDIVDAGIASVWVGQPSYSSITPYPQFTSAAVDMAGRGYYVVGAVQPLWTSGWRGVQWEIGGGVGMASMEFTARSGSHSLSPTPSSPPIEKRQTSFSALAYTELKVLLTDNFSVGLTADLVYVPEDVPAVQGIKFESTTFGTTSVGIAFGIHL